MRDVILGVPDLIAAYGKRLDRECPTCDGRTLYEVPTTAGAFVACSCCDTTPAERERLGIPTRSMH